jgi:hypothetical protein
MANVRYYINCEGVANTTFGVYKELSQEIRKNNIRDIMAGYDFAYDKIYIISFNDAVNFEIMMHKLSGDELTVNKIMSMVRNG